MSPAVLLSINELLSSHLTSIFLLTGLILSATRRTENKQSLQLRANSNIPKLFEGKSKSEKKCSAFKSLPFVACDEIMRQPRVEIAAV